MLLSLRNVSLSLGGPPLLEHAEFAIESGERVCLIGRNGVGKSTLLKLLQGLLPADEGELVRAPGLRMAYLRQDVPPASVGRIYDVVAQGLGELGELLARYEALSHALTAADLDELGRLQGRIEAKGGWQYEQQIRSVLSRMDLDGERPFASLSGGLKRRVLLAQALVQSPDLLLLDEPTNHLDITHITWLEEFLLGFNGALLFVSHDRRFVRRLATRLVELDRGRLTSWPGDYDRYLAGKEAELATQARHDALFDKHLAQEEVWIRQGIKARRTRNEGRVRALQALRQTRSARREVTGKARLNVQTAAPSGQLVAELTHVTHGHGERTLIRDFSTTILRGDKIGIIGPNGCGKTTLINILLGQLKPDQGQVRLGSQLEIAYFDQLRVELDEQLTPVDIVGQGHEVVMQNGRARHVIGYLQDFLFEPAQARAPIKALSGGERNRLLLAKLFAQPANVLVLDEPTNDLDVETLEILETLLVEYTGTLILVSHDRDFLDHVVTSCIAFEGDGLLGEYVGGYDDYLRQRSLEPAQPQPPVKAKPQPAAPPSKPQRKRLSYKEEQERQILPARIEALETEQAEISRRLGEPDFYQQTAAQINQINARLKDLADELQLAYARWEALESMTEE